jgi:hypothetical protein
MSTYPVPRAIMPRRNAPHAAGRAGSLDDCAPSLHAVARTAATFRPRRCIPPKPHSALHVPPNTCAPAGVNTAALLLAELQTKCQVKQQELEALSDERARLRRRAAVVAAAVLHCGALNELAAAVHGAGAGGSNGSGGGGGSQSPSLSRTHGGSSSSTTTSSGAAVERVGSSPTVAAAAAAVTSAAAKAEAAAQAEEAAEATRRGAREWQEHLSQMARELTGSKDGGAAAAAGPEAAVGPTTPPGAPPGGGAAAAAGDWDARTDAATIGLLPLAVHWWPAGAPLARGQQHSTVAKLQEFARETHRLLGCLLPRVQSGAPDAEACLRRLAEVRAHNFVAHSVLLFSSTSSVLAEIVLRPFENGATLAPPQAPAAAAESAMGTEVEGRGEAAAGAAAEGSGAPLPLLVYALRQARLSADQVRCLGRATGRLSLGSLGLKTSSPTQPTYPPNQHPTNPTRHQKLQEEVAADIFEVWQARAAAISRRRDALVAAAAGRAPDARLVSELAAAQTATVVNLGVFSLLFYDSLLSVEQVGGGARAGGAAVSSLRRGGLWLSPLHARTHPPTVNPPNPVCRGRPGYLALRTFAGGDGRRPSEAEGRAAGARAGGRGRRGGRRSGGGGGGRAGGRRGPAAVV